MLPEEASDDLRSLENKLRSVEMRIIEIGSEQSKIDREREEIEIEKRRIRRKISALEMEIVQFEGREAELTKVEFELHDEKKALMKKKENLRVSVDEELEIRKEQERKQRLARF